MRKDQPRHFRARQASDGSVWFFWEPPYRIRAAGIRSIKLGTDRATAEAEAERQNEQLDQWRIAAQSKVRLPRSRTVVRAEALGVLLLDQIYASARKRARRFNRVCTLTRDELDQLWQRANGKCEVTGVPFDLLLTKHGLRRPWTPSLDRIDSRKGYALENCRLVCAAANYAMQEWGEVVLLRMLSFLNGKRQRQLSQRRTRTALEVPKPSANAT